MTGRQYRRKSAISVGNGVVLWLGAWADQGCPLAGLFLSLNPNQYGWELTGESECQAFLEQLSSMAEVTLPSPDGPFCPDVLVGLDDSCMPWLEERFRNLVNAIGETP